MRYTFTINFVLVPDGALIIGHVTLCVNIMRMLWPCSRSLMLHDSGSMAHNVKV